MHDLTTSLLTLIVGVIIFISTQYFLKLVLEPVSSLRKTLADVSSTVLSHQAAITNSTADPEIEKDLRRLSSALRAGVYEVRWYRHVAALCGIPSEPNILSGCHQLNLLSAGMRSESQHGKPLTWWATQNMQSLISLGELLGIQTSYSS